MQAGKMSGRGRGGNTKLPFRNPQLSVCDLPSADFKKAWLTLKELHDKELLHLQTKLTALRKERLAEERKLAFRAKIRELTKQQKVLKETISRLREQLSAKTCSRCLSNEDLRNILYKEFLDMQKQNEKVIAGLTRERDYLRKENKRLSDRLTQVTQFEQHSASLSSSEDLFIPCSQKHLPLKERADLSAQERVQAYVNLIKAVEGEEEEESLQCPASPVFDEEIYVVPETSFEKLSSSDSKRSKTEKSSTAWFSLKSTQESPSDKADPPEIEYTLRSSSQKSTQKSQDLFKFSGSPSTISSEGKEDPRLVSETSEENMPGYCSPLVSPWRRRPSSRVFPIDYTNKSATFKYRSAIRAAYAEKAKSAGEQSTVKSATEVTGTTRYATDNPHNDTDSSVGSTIKRKGSVGSTIKRKVRTKPRSMI